MQAYSMCGGEFAEGEVGFDAVLAKAYSHREKPLCLCRRDVKLQLYISHRYGSYVLSRWPGTGALHAPVCEHYETPDFLTGLGQVKGSAIIENRETGETDLKFGFALSRGPARAAPSALTNDKFTVKSTGQRLTMRGLLHYLWDRAQLTHWHPRMAGKRNWYVVRRSLLSGALLCRAKGAGLAQSLFIPETFSLDHKDEIAGRRRSDLAPAYANRNAIMIVIGEVKAIEKARFGEQIVVRHLPDWPFSMDENMARRFHKRFGVEEQLWNAEDGRGHLIIAATFSVGKSGLPEMIEASVMPVTAEWLPFESFDERALIAKAVNERRHFVKGLRLNLGADVPIASLSLTDTGANATAVFLERNSLDPAYDDALAELMRTPGLDHMTWSAGRSLALRVDGQSVVRVAAREQAKSAKSAAVKIGQKPEQLGIKL